MMKRNIIFNFDMDGVLARWGNASIEETFLPGYFENLVAEEVVIRVVHRLISAGYDVNILSAAYDNGLAVPEKSRWLDKKVGLHGYTRTFVLYGQKKEDYMRCADVNVLLDDYSKNLHSWVAAGNLGFKFYWSHDGMSNGTKGTWHGYSVNDKMTDREIFDELVCIAKQYAKTNMLKKEKTI